MGLGGKCMVWDMLGKKGKKLLWFGGGKWFLIRRGRRGGLRHRSGENRSGGDKAL